MGSVKFVEHQGKRILLIDMAHCELDGVVAVIRETKKIISQQPVASVLTLTDVTGTHPNASTTRVLKEFAAHNKPYVRAGAVVGVDKVRKLIYAIVSQFSSRQFGLFETHEEAKNWLVTQ